MSEEESTTPPEVPAEKAPAATKSAPAPAEKAGEDRGMRKTRVGIVTSDKMHKTIVINVVRRVPHPHFKKIIKRTTKLYAHDEKEEAAVGDRVRIVESRPLSKKKRWRLLEVLGH